MIDIDTGQVTESFFQAWRAAGCHLQDEAARRGLKPIWLKARLEGPFLEHLSLRLGNQLFFVRLEGVEPGLDVPGSRRGLGAIALECQGHACVMPMTRRGGEWAPAAEGWSLLDAASGTPVVPEQLITDAPIEMTDWEVHDCAVQVVRGKLEEEGRRIMSSQSNPEVQPSLWFVGDSGPEWVIVQAARYPSPRAEPPENLEELAAHCFQHGERGYFASVALASAYDAFDPAGGRPEPLWRGGGMYVSYAGLEPVQQLLRSRGSSDGLAQ
jgi:hypothetical protein